MATFEKRLKGDGKASYRVKVRIDGSVSRSKTFRRLTDAKKWAQSTEAAIREGRDFPEPQTRKRTVAELIERYEQTVLPQKSKSMIRNQRIQLRWWRERIGKLRLFDVTAATLVECRDELAKGKTKSGRPRSKASVNRYLAALSHVFTVAMKEWEWVATNPFERVTRYREPRDRVRYLSDDERARLLAECKSSSNRHLYTVVVLALSTGCRREEIMTLTWANVDLERGMIVLERTKNKERRAVPITGPALELLRVLRAGCRAGNPLLFPRRDGRKPIAIRKAWDNAVKAANIEDFRFHDLRHSCASYLAMNGATLPEIAHILGHKTYDMVKRYAHLSEQHTAKVLDKMTAAVFEAESVGNH